MSIFNQIEVIIQANDSSSPIEYYPAVKGDAEHTCANTAKAQRELGWKAETRNFDGLRKYAEWVKNNP